MATEMSERVVCHLSELLGVVDASFSPVDEGPKAWPPSPWPCWLSRARREGTGLVKVGW